MNYTKADQYIYVRAEIFVEDLFSLFLLAANTSTKLNPWRIFNPSINEYREITVRLVYKQQNFDPLAKICASTVYKI